MSPKYVATLLLGFVVLQLTLGQDSENATILEGSDDSGTTTTPMTTPLLEEVYQDTNTTSEVANACDICTCSYELDSTTVDCSHRNITLIPEGINENTTNLYLQNNELENLPTSIANLKQLKILNASNNVITEVESDSIGELKYLTILDLTNNKLSAFPQELANSFGLTSLEELHLNGNDISETLTAENFSQFGQLKKITLPEITNELIYDLCTSISLQTVCGGENCTKCQHVENNTYENEAIIPSLISADGADFNSVINETISDNATNESTSPASDLAYTSVSPTTPFSIRAAVDKEPSISIAILSANTTTSINEQIDNSTITATVESNTTITTNNTLDSEVIDATSTEASKTGGVSTLLVGLIVAGMALVVAGVVIKKNWKTVSNTFSSNRQSTTERPAAHANCTPEEMPLNDKSPA